jgi:hypothetical protein
LAIACWAFIVAHHAKVVNAVHETPRRRRRRVPRGAETFVQVQVDPEQTWGAAQACPQLPQFLGSEPVSVHDDPQQATGQVISVCHWPTGSHPCCSVPRHRI